MARRPRNAKPQQEPDSRWITVHGPFDFHWSRLSVTKYPAGEFRVKNAVADYAVEKGYATERKQSEEEPGTAETADTGPAEGVDRADGTDAARPAGGPAVDHDAG